MTYVCGWCEYRTFDKDDLDSHLCPVTDEEKERQMNGADK